MLLKVAALFRARAEPAPDRTANRLVVPKGDVAKMHVLADIQHILDRRGLIRSHNRPAWKQSLATDHSCGAGLHGTNRSLLIYM